MRRFGWLVSFVSLVFLPVLYLYAESSAEVPAYKRMEQSTAVYDELTAGHPYKLGASVTDALLYGYSGQAIIQGYSFFCFEGSPSLKSHSVVYLERPEGQEAYIFNAKETRKLINKKYGYDESKNPELEKLRTKKDLTLDEYSEIVKLTINEAIFDGESWEPVINAIKSEIDARRKAKSDPLNSAIIELKREVLTTLFICQKKDLKDPYINLETPRAKFALSQPVDFSNCGPMLKRD